MGKKRRRVEYIIALFILIFLAFSRKKSFGTGKELLCAIMGHCVYLFINSFSVQVLLLGLINEMIDLQVYRLPYGLCLCSIPFVTMALKIHSVLLRRGYREQNKIK